MMNKDKAEIILAEIKQQIKSGVTGNISFSSHTIMWMAESLVQAIDEAETARKEKKAALKKLTAEKETAVAEMKKVKEDYFNLMQNFRKSETRELALKSKGKLQNKWQTEPE